MNPLRILHIIPSLAKGGAERLALTICEELSRNKDVQVKLITLSPDNQYIDLTKNIDWQVIPARYIPSITKPNINETSGLSAFIESFQPDIIHSHLFEAEMVSRNTLYDKAVYFTHCHDNMLQFRNVQLGTFLNKQCLTNYYEKRLLLKQYLKTKANHFITISTHTEAYYREVLPAKLAANIHLLHNAIDFYYFNHAYIADKPITSPIQILNIGAFVEKKNQALLIDIGVKLKSQNIPFQITFIGEGPLKSVVEKKAIESGIENNVVFIGIAEDTRPYLKDAHFYVHTALYEPFGLVLLEAMAAGLPIISLDGGGNKDIIINGSNGYIIDTANPDLFVEKITALSNNNEQYQTLSSNAIQFAAGYDIKMYCNKLLSLYKQAIQLQA